MSLLMFPIKYQHAASLQIWILLNIIVSIDIEPVITVALIFREDKRQRLFQIAFADYRYNKRVTYGS